MKKLICSILIISIVLALSSCSSQSEKSVYSSDDMRVSSSVIETQPTLSPEETVVKCLELFVDDIDEHEELLLGVCFFDYLKGHSIYYKTIEIIDTELADDDDAFSFADEKLNIDAYYDFSVVYVDMKFQKNNSNTGFLDDEETGRLTLGLVRTSADSDWKIRFIDKLEATT